MSQDAETVIANRLRRAGDAYPVGEPNSQLLGAAIRRRRRRRLTFRITGALMAVAVATTVVTTVALNRPAGTTKVSVGSPAASPTPQTGPTVAPQLLFRPVDCTIPAFLRTNEATRVSPRVTAALCRSLPPVPGWAVPTTSPIKDLPKATVILNLYPKTAADEGRFVLGPADLTGASVSTASAVKASGGHYEVQVTLTHSGLVAFNRVASERHRYYKTGVTNQLFKAQEAIDLNGQVLYILDQAHLFTGPIPIVGSFTQLQAKAIAKQIRASAGR
jgi:hypothetical protein